MQTLDTVAAMRGWSAEVRRAGRRIALVPTMGCLHEGHLSLVRLARRACDRTVVSVFVNPTQFGAGEDFERYPRDLAADAALCGGEGVDVLFAPAVGEMYAPDHSAWVDETELSKGLCGALRPGHFRGVATVVAKLFNVVCPHVAVFGRKDAQQVRVVQRLVRDLSFAVEILAAPIVRERDGLAMSSRNAYLSAAERRWAPSISAALRAAQASHAAGEHDAGALCSNVERALRSGAHVEIDYVACVDAATLRPIACADRPALLAVAVRVGRTRLIDNIELGSPA